MAKTIINRHSFRKREAIEKTLVGGVQLDREMRMLKNATWSKGAQKKYFVCGLDTLELFTEITTDDDGFVEAWCNVRLNKELLLSPQNYNEDKIKVLNYLSERLREPLIPVKEVS